MRYIEIQDGVNLKVSEIEGIKKLENGNCEIYTHHRKYLSTYPYKTILSMLKEGEIVDRGLSDDEKIKSTMEKLSKVLNQAQHFAG